MAELFAQGDDVPPAARPVSIPLRAGDIACFSSFCPHMTLPNTREGYVRKGYILQYLADGTELFDSKVVNVSKNRKEGPEFVPVPLSLDEETAAHGRGHVFLDAARL